MAENPGIALRVEGYQGGTGFDGVFFLKITHDSKDVQSWGRGMMVCNLKYLGRTMQQLFYSFEGKNTFVFLDVWYNSFGCFMFVFFTSVLLFLIDWTILVHCLCLHVLLIIDCHKSILAKKSGQEMHHVFHHALLDPVSPIKLSWSTSCVCVQLHLNTLDFWCKIPIKYHIYIYMYIFIVYELFSEVDERCSEILGYLQDFTLVDASCCIWAWRPRHVPWHLMCA